jgi:hypothetical protein
VGAENAQLGKAIYFSDCLSRALDFCKSADDNRPTKFVMLCEVSLGSQSHVNRRNPNLESPPEGFDSVTGVGREGPALKQFITLADGCKIPCGKVE